jgi:serine/threonine protein kinase
MVAVTDRLYPIGDKIAGDFNIRRVMEGGLGIVYAVEHHELGSLVLKGPKRQEEPAVRKSFKAEAETWARLGDHPNIVRAFRVEEIAGRSLWPPSLSREMSRAACLSATIYWQVPSHMWRPQHGQLSSVSGWNMLFRKGSSSTEI